MRTFVVVALLLTALPAAAHHGGGSRSGAGGQLTMSPDTLPAGKFYLGLRIDETNFENLSDSHLNGEVEDGHARHVSDWEDQVAVEGEVGIVSGLSAGLLIPYKRMDDFREGLDEEELAELEEMGVTHNPVSHPAGLGDVLVWGKVRLINTAFQLGVMAGVELPTGDRDYRSPTGEVLEPDHQAGSGSLDFVAGIAAGYHGERWAIQAALVAKINTMGVRRFEIGDHYLLSIGGGYRVLGDGKAWGLTVTADAWAGWTSREIDHGRRNPDSDGWDGQVAPGVRLTVGPVLVQVAVPFQFLNTIHQEADQDFRVVLSGGITF